jgi:hypothetical protein
MISKFWSCGARERGPTAFGDIGKKRKLRNNQSLASYVFQTKLHSCRSRFVIWLWKYA